MQNIRHLVRKFLKSKEKEKENKAEEKNIMEKGTRKRPKVEGEGR